MYSMIKKALPAALMACAALAPLAAHAEVVVIVSAKNAAGNLGNDQVADIFLGKANTLPGGQAATPVDQADGSPIREEFYQKVAKKTPAQLKAHWSKIIFTGKGQPPKDAGDSASVRKLVADNPAMIGYVDKSVVDASVKVVATLR